MTGIEFIARGGLEGMQHEILMLRLLVVSLTCAWVFAVYLWLDWLIRRAAKP